MLHDQPWAKDAACRNERDLFALTFPDDEDRVDAEAVDMALDICSPCPVREECLLYALEHGIDYGVWGGSTPEEREAVRKAAEELS